MTEAISSALNFIMVTCRLGQARLAAAGPPRLLGGPALAERAGPTLHFPYVGTANRPSDSRIVCLALFSVTSCICFSRAARLASYTVSPTRTSRPPSKSSLISDFKITCRPSTCVSRATIRSRSGLLSGCAVCTITSTRPRATLSCLRAWRAIARRLSSRPCLDTTFKNVSSVGDSRPPNALSMIGNLSSCVSRSDRSVASSCGSLSSTSLTSDSSSCTTDSAWPDFSAAPSRALAYTEPSFCSAGSAISLLRAIFSCGRRLACPKLIHVGKLINRLADDRLMLLRLHLAANDPAGQRHGCLHAFLRNRVQRLVLGHRNVGHRPLALFLRRVPGLGH